MGAPFSFLSNMTGPQARRLEHYLYRHRLDPDISASDLLSWMREHYNIDYTVGISDARLIIGVRWELEIRVFIGNIPQYVFAHDVPLDFVTMIEERGLQGVNIERGFVREYHTPYAAHLLGFTGPIPEASFERFVTELGYPMDAHIGLSGVERAFEEQLRGISGEQIITTSSGGTVTNVVTERDPVPGQHVFLTIDIELQQAVEHALKVYIDHINRYYRDDETRINGGAVVVTDVRTGEVLASASYPAFDISSFNRALNGRYSPGSTFKMVTAFAAMREGVVGRWSEINCVGRFVKYREIDGFAPPCWILRVTGGGHGPKNVVQALASSCNYFFFESASRLDRGDGAAYAGRMLAEAAYEFGLGRRTGIQIGDHSGILGSPEYKAETFEGPRGVWVRGDTVMTSFGHGYNEFTPIQLANFTATIANGGVLYELSLMRQIRSNDMSEVEERHTPTPMHWIQETHLISILQEGRIEASRVGTGRSVFADYHIPVASKTGTVQVEGQDYNNATFVAYAPSNNPEIAISVVVERGGSGADVMVIAREVFDFYFARAQSFPIATYGELIP
jgi:penicillin-binding protein 2